MTIKKLGKSTLFAGVLMLFICFLALTVRADETSFTVQGVTVTDDFVSHDEIDCSQTQGSGDHGCCWAFAAKAYYKIWGETFSSSGDNLLDNVDPEDRYNTAENWAKYLSSAEPGANVRMDNSSDTGTGDSNGHSMVFLGMGDDGESAWFWEGNYDGYGDTRIKCWNFEDLVSGYYSKYTYIKYIIWPGADPYVEKNSPDFAVPELNSVESTGSGLKVTWSKVSNAGGYNVYRKTKDGSWKRVGSTSSASSTSYTDTSAKSCVTYYYTVAAKTSYKEGCYDESGMSGFYMQSISSSAEGRSSYVKVSWTECENCEGYYIYRKLSGGEYEKIKTVSADKTSFKDTSVKVNKKYVYKIRAYYGKYTTSADPVSAYCLKEPNLKSAVKIENGIKIKWARVTNASKYYIYRKTENGSWKKIASVSDSGSTSSKYQTYKDYSGKNKTKYWYTVRAVRGDSQSTYDKSGLSSKFILNAIEYKVTKAVNYRTGPGTSYKVAGTFSKGTKVYVMKNYTKTADGYKWKKIFKDGKYYYVILDCLKKIS